MSKKGKNYDTALANRVRTHLSDLQNNELEEKEMFGGLAFLINGKMCINVSGQNLMCRFDPRLTEELAGKPGYSAMIMKGKVLKGYCFVDPSVIINQTDLEFWINLCLDFNESAKSSRS